MWYGHDMWSSGWLMVIWMLIFWGGLSLLVMWGMRTVLTYTQPSPARTSSPLEIAQARLARGEISREEFTGIVQDLKHSNPEHNS
jgi:uncharacterized membrane protein